MFTLWPIERSDWIGYLPMLLQPVAGGKRSRHQPSHYHLDDRDHRCCYHCGRDFRCKYQTITMNLDRFPKPKANLITQNTFEMETGDIYTCD